jgi:hypothetical protein
MQPQEKAIPELRVTLICLDHEHARIALPKGELRCETIGIGG